MQFIYSEGDPGFRCEKKKKNKSQLGSKLDHVFYTHKFNKYMYIYLQLDHIFYTCKCYKYCGICPNL